MPNIDRLIQRWQDGDEYAAKALYEHYQAPTFRLAYGLLGNAHDAEEAAQDALTYALMNIHHYDTRRASFKTWLHTIAVSRCRDRQRRKRLPLLALADWLKRGYEPPSPTPGPEHQAMQAETQSQVWHAVQSLSPPLREAVLLRYWAGHTYREMAEIMDCPIPTAQSRVRLAYKQLRTALAPENLNHHPLKEEALR